MLRDQLDALDTTAGLVRAAVAVSMHQLDDADPQAVETALDDLAEQVQGRLSSDQPRAIVAHAHHVLFDEARFRGNVGDYDQPDNSYLSRVLQTRLGLPITLTLVYKAVLERLGVRVLGVNAPGHFLAAVRGEVVGDLKHPDAMAIIDPFAGGKLLSRDQAIDRVVQATGGDLVLNASVDFLPIATHTQWLMRLARNLAMGFERRGQLDDANAMAEMMRLIEAEG